LRDLTGRISISSPLHPTPLRVRALNPISSMLSPTKSAWAHYSFGAKRRMLSE
jgi:hypothetical protein